MARKRMAASISVAALVVMAGGCAASASSTRPEGTHHPTTVPAPAPSTTVAAPTTTGPPSAVPTTVPAPAVQAPGWSAPLTTLPPGGGFTSVSCISDTFCVAVGGGTDGDDSSLTAGSGVAVSWDGAAWSDPVVYFPAPASGPVTAPVLPSISCTSGPSCVIVDGSGHVSYGNGTTWSPPVALAAPPALPANPDDPGPGRAGSRSDALDCPTAGVCAFVDNTGHAYLLHGGAWAAPQTLGSSSGPGSATVSRYQPGRVGVSCPSPTSCTAVVGPSVLDWSGSSWSVEPAPWTSSLVSGAADPTAIACPSAGECLIVNGSGFAERTPGGGWSPEQTIDPHGELDGLSCPSTTFCMATDADGSVVSWNGSTWSAPVRVVPAATDYTGIGTSVSCPDTQFCMVMNSDGDYATYAGPGAH